MGDTAIKLLYNIGKGDRPLWAACRIFNGLCIHPAISHFNFHPCSLDLTGWIQIERIRTRFGMSEIYKKKSNMSRNYKIWGTFFAVRGKSVTRSFCVEIAETKNMPSALTWQKKGMFPPSCGYTKPSARIRSIVSSHRNPSAIRVRIERKGRKCNLGI